MIVFEHIIYLHLLWIIPLLLVAFSLHFRFQQRMMLRLGKREHILHLLSGPGLGEKRLRIAVRLSAFFFLLLSFANPQRRHAQSVDSATESPRALVLAIDVSGSMLVEDVLPNRQEQAKIFASQLLKEFAKEAWVKPLKVIHISGVSDVDNVNYREKQLKLENANSIGLVLFAGNAYPWVPLTNDYAYVDNAIRGIHTDPGIRQGTSLNEALRMSALLFPESLSGRRTICVLSDGESHGRHSGKTADSLRRKGIKIITIAIGTVRGGQIPVMNAAGHSGYKVDKKGIPVLSRLNARNLRDLSGNTSGDFFEPGNRMLEVKACMEAISHTKDTSIKKIPADMALYPVFLWLGLVLLVVETIVPGGMNQIKNGHDN